MALPIVPDNQDILDLLKAQVQGPYRWVHHAWIPYVRVGPATATEPVTISASARLHLLKQRRLRLTGLDETRDFTVVFHGTEIHLVQTPMRATQLDALDSRPPLVSPKAVSMPNRPMHLGTPVVDIVAEGAMPGEASAPRPPPHVRPMRVAPDPVPAPAPAEAPVCDALRDLAVREALEPGLGDYLVVPEAQAATYAPLPRWVATTRYVDHVYVVKPRLGLHQPVEG